MFAVRIQVIEAVFKDGGITQSGKFYGRVRENDIYELSSISYKASANELSAEDIRSIWYALQHRLPLT